MIISLVLCGCDDTSYNVSVATIIEENQISADDGTLLYSAKVEYPEISTGNKQVDEIINKTYIEEKEKVLKCETGTNGIKNVYNDFQNEDLLWRTYESRLKVNVKYCSDNYVSFYNLSFNYSGGAHGLIGMTSYNFSTTTGEELALEDVFTEDFKDFAENYIISELDKRNKEEKFLENYKDCVKEKLENNYDWYLTRNSFVLAFNPYEIASFAQGFIEVKIPYSKLNDYMKKALFQ